MIVRRFRLKARAFRFWRCRFWSGANALSISPAIWSGFATAVASCSPRRGGFRERVLEICNTTFSYGVNLLRSVSTNEP